MRGVLALSLILGLTLGCNRGTPDLPAPAAAATPPAPTADAELKWAHEVAENFLNAGFPADTALAWLSQDFKQRLTKNSVEYYGYGKWSIASEEMAPGQDEAVFKGTLHASRKGTILVGTGGSSGPFDGIVPFTLRVVKEKDGGKWRVDALQHGQPAPLPALEAAERAPKKELDGTWAAIGMETDGVKVGDEYLKSYTFTFIGDKMTSGTFGYSSQGIVTLDTARKPKSIDVVRAQKGDGYYLMVGIYELEGKKLRISYFMGDDVKTRPEEFKSRVGPVGARHILLLLERVGSR